MADIIKQAIDDLGQRQRGELLNAGELAGILHISKQSISDRRQRGNFPPLAMESKFRAPLWKAGTVLAWLKEGHFNGR